MPSDRNKQIRIATTASFVASSIYGLNKIQSQFTYAAACMKLYTFSGIVGLVGCLVELPLSMEMVSEDLWMWSFVLGLPLVTSEMWHLSGMSTDLTPLNLIVPIYSMVSYHFGGRNNPEVSLLASSHSFSIMSLIATSIITDSTSGFIVSFLYFLAIFRSENHSDVDVNNFEVWTLFISVANAFTVVMLQKYETPAE